MRTSKQPKFLLDPNRSFGRPNMGEKSHHPQPEFDLLTIADIVFHHLTMCPEKVLRTMKFIKIGFGQANKGPVSLFVNGEFEEEFRAPREVSVDISLSSDEGERSVALAMVRQLFCDDHQKVIRSMIDSAELAHLTLGEYVLPSN